MSLVDFKRRHFIRSSCGYMLAIPFLSSLAPKSLAQAHQKKRFIAVRTLNGQVPEHFYPQRPMQKMGTNIYHKSFRQGQTLSPVLDSGFKDIASKLSLFRGLDHSKGGHNDTIMLTAGVHHYESNSTVLISNTIKDSLDELIARSGSVYQSTPFLRHLKLEPSVNEHNPYRSFSFYKGEKTFYERNMRSLYQFLFYGKNNPALQGQLTKTKKQKAIDLAKDGYQQLLRNRSLSSLDKSKLNQYLDTLNDLENKFASGSSSQGQACREIVNQQLNPSDHDSINDMAIELIALSLMCNMTQVVSYSMHGFGRYPGETNSSFHDISHWEFSSSKRFQNVGYGPERKMDYALASEQKYLRYYKWAAGKVAKLMYKLDQIQDSDGKSILDNSLVMWGNEFAGADHSPYSIPILIGGTLGGRVKPGYWDYTLRPLRYYHGRSDVHMPVGTVPYVNLLTTLANLYGVDRNVYEKNGRYGFGEFDLKQFNHYFYDERRVGNVEIKPRDNYASFIGSETNQRKSVPGWL